MKRTTALMFIVAASLSATSWSQSKAGLKGKFTTFDAPGAGTGLSQGTLVSAFNEGGTVVGAVADLNGNLTGFLRSGDGGIVTFTDPSAILGASFGAVPFGVNSRNDVVGIYEPDTAEFLYTSFLRTHSGKFSDVNAPNITSFTLIDTWAFGINRRGEIAGQYYLPDGTVEGFVQSPNGTFDAFTAPGAESTSAVSINDNGSVTGYFSDPAFANHGFERSPSGVINVFDVPGAGTGPAQGTSPSLIYPSGAIVGFFVDGTSITHGFVRAPNGGITVVDVPAAVGTTVSGAAGGKVVGTYVDLGGVSHGFIKDSDGRMLTLDAPGAGTSGGLGTYVIGVTGAGLVVGYDTDSNGAYHGFVWRPTDN